MYMDHVWLIFNVPRIVKYNDYSLYSDPLFKMADIYFSFDGQNYAGSFTFRGWSCEPNNQLNVCTTSVTEGEVARVKQV